MLWMLSGVSFAWNTKPYMALSGGYGNYQNMYDNDGATGVMRFAVGTLFPEQHHFSLGIETGIETGNRMRLTNSTTNTLGVFTLPVFITIKPPVDLLVTAMYRFQEHFFIIGKFGAVYLSTLIDNTTIQNISETRPEIQAGIGWELSNKVNINIFYQRFFGARPDLTHINFADGTATLNHLPTWQALFLGVEYHL